MSDGYRVEPFSSTDAEGVAVLFREVYGDSYPIKVVYDPASLVAISQEGRYFPFVVRHPSRGVIAYGALVQSAPYRGIYEFVQGIVSPGFQGAGLGRMLFEWVERYLPTLPGAEAYFGEAVCNHAHTQKAGALIKTVETGIEVDLMSGEPYAKGVAASGRVSVVDQFRTFVSRPQTVYVPGVYEDICRTIYGGLDDPRTIALSTGGPDPDLSTQMSVQTFEHVGAVRVAVSLAGADFADRFDREERSLVQGGIKVVQVWLRLSQPWVGEIAGMLRRRGYFLGGVLPRWFDDDGLLMQRTIDRPNWEGIHLYTQRAQRMLEFIHEDWSTVQGLTESRE